MTNDTTQEPTTEPSRQGVPAINVILASASPRRRELLEQVGVKFTVRVSDVDETLDEELLANPSVAAQKLAEKKAGAVVQELLAEEGLEGRFVVIGADTMVVLNGEIFGKPANFSNAKHMLRKLSGNTHQVHTGVALWAISAPKAQKVSVRFGSFVDTTDVTFYELSDEQIDEYLAKGESYDKAGAYGIQGEGKVLVKGINGSLDTVIGLPAERLAREYAALLGIA